MQSSVVYGMLTEEAVEDSDRVGVYAYADGKVLVPNQEAAVIQPTAIPQLLDFANVKDWDEKIDAYCEEKGIAVGAKGWWLISNYSRR